LAVSGQAHLVVHQAHGAQPLFAHPDDRSSALQCLRDALAGRQVALHAFALLRDRVWLLLTPAAGDALGRTMQAFGRAFTAGFHRRHGGSGSVWAGRYRCTVVEPGATLRDVLLFVEQSPVRANLAASVGDWSWSSAAHHLGIRRDPLVTSASSYWALGNTPFERATAYGLLAADLLPEVRANEIASAAEKGWALGSVDFLGRLGQDTRRPLQPRPRGRPRGQRGTLSVPK
jgi:putative transposase